MSASDGVLRCLPADCDRDAVEVGRRNRDLLHAGGRAKQAGGGIGDPADPLRHHRVGVVRLSAGEFAVAAAGVELKIVQRGDDAGVSGAVHAHPDLRDDFAGEGGGIRAVLGVGAGRESCSLYADHGEDADRENQDADQGFEQHDALLPVPGCGRMFGHCFHQQARVSLVSVTLGSQTRICPPGDTLMLRQRSGPLAAAQAPAAG